MIDLASALVALMICIPAGVMALKQSSWLVDYLFFVVALNRGVRRVVDYSNGYFNPYSLISLTPIVVGGFAVLVVLVNLNSRANDFSSSALKTIVRYSFATTAAFVVGFLNVRFGAIYALGDYIAPIGLIGYGAIYSGQEGVFNRWCNSVALSGVFVAVYGVWQFYTIPPWDAFWVQAVNFEGYLGTLEPTKMTLFSTMSERGPAAIYLCSCLIILVLRPGTLGFLRLPSAGIVLVAMLLTYSRTTVIQAGLAILLFPLLNRGAGTRTIFAISLVALLFGEPLLQRLPGMEQAAARVGTIGSLPSDSSFVGRLQLLRYSIALAMSEPLGLGIGSHGLASKVSSGGGGIGDSTGYVEALRTFGWLGFLIIVSVFVSLWKSTQMLMQDAVSDRNVYLFRIWFISGLVAAFSGGWMFTASFFWVLGGYCLQRSDETLGFFGHFELYDQDSGGD